MSYLSSCYITFLHMKLGIVCDLCQFFLEMPYFSSYYTTFIHMKLGIVCHLCQFFFLSQTLILYTGPIHSCIEDASLGSGSIHIALLNRVESQAICLINSFFELTVLNLSRYITMLHLLLFSVTIFKVPVPLSLLTACLLPSSRSTTQYFLHTFIPVLATLVMKLN